MIQKLNREIVRKVNRRVSWTVKKIWKANLARTDQDDIRNSNAETKQEENMKLQQRKAYALQDFLSLKSCFFFQRFPQESLLSFFHGFPTQQPSNFLKGFLQVFLHGFPQEFLHRFLLKFLQKLRLEFLQRFLRSFPGILSGAPQKISFWNSFKDSLWSFFSYSIHREFFHGFFQDLTSDCCSIFSQNF